MHSIFCDYDIVHYHAIGPATFSFLPRIAGKRTVVTVHGLDWQREKWGRCAKLYLKFGERAAVAFPNRTIAVSKHLQSYLEEKYRKSVSYIPNAVTEPVILQPEKIRQYGLGSRDYILFVARLVPEKGCHFLIDAYKRLNPDMKLVIAGGSSLSDDYVRDLRQHESEKIIFTGYVHGELLQELYSNAYCYVHPSTVEGLPFTLLEAVSYGNCVIASDIPPNAEVVRDMGMLFASQDVDGLEQALKRVIDNPGLARSLACKARTSGLAEYNYESVTEQTVEVYRKVLSAE
jgi:glycosyltransferase involved in cell wall biosynthesis